MKTRYGELNVETAWEAFEATELTPVFNNFGDGKTFGCLLTAFLAHKAPEHMDKFREVENDGLRWSFLSAELDVSVTYLQTMAKAYDLPETWSVEINQIKSDKFRELIQLGLDCHAKLKPIGP